MTATWADPTLGDQRSLNALLDAILLNSTEAIVIVDDRGSIHYATAGAMLLTGHDVDAMSGASAFDFLHPDDVEAAAQLLSRRLEYDGADLGHEIRIRHASGEWVAVLATASLIPDDVVGACAITLNPLADAGLLERSLRSRIVVGEYANRLSAGFMEATHSIAVLERIRISLGEIGLLTGAEVVEVLLERQQRGSVEQLAHWESASRSADGSSSVVEAASGPKSVELLLSEEYVIDDTSMPTRQGGCPFWMRDGIASLLSTPFVVGEQRGVVVLMRVEPGPSWSGADTELIRSVASVYGRALQMARFEELLALTYREGPAGFAIRTWFGRLVDCNQRYLDLSRLTREAAERSDLDSMLRPVHRPVLAGRMEQLERGEIDRIRIDVELTRGDGSHIWAQINAVPLRVPGSSERLVLTAIEDVTETHTQRIELEHAAHHDPLTGVANRTAMTDAIRRLANDGEYPALLVIDLDRFKFVNDSLGHTVGDRLLQAVADRITGEVRPIDVVARLGGDEFAIVVPGLDVEGAHQLAARLQRFVDHQFDIDGRSITQTLSIGIALGEGSADSPELLVRADRALHAAKTRGRNSCVIYDESLEDEVVAGLTIERELRSAVTDGRLEVYFQPEFAIANGRILGAEALLRWNHPARGLVDADEFMGIAERTGLIDDIGRFALREACRTFVQIEGTVGLTLRVNISAREFARPELPALVRAALAESGLAPERLCLEMTETTLMDSPEIALETFARLHSIGVQSAIDDFGTGYSSLAYLKRFPVDAVKIDRTFVEDIVTDPDSRAIVGSIMGLSEALSFVAVAEGVETVEQLDTLRELGCRSAQGFLVARALRADEFADFMAADPDGVMPGIRRASCT